MASKSLFLNCVRETVLLFFAHIINSRVYILFYVLFSNLPCRTVTPFISVPFQRGPTVAERRRQQQLEKRRQKVSDDVTTTQSPLQRPRQKKAEPLPRQQFGARTSQRPERTSSSQRQATSRDARPQYSERLSYPQAAGSIVRPQYTAQDSRQQYQDSRGQYQDTQQYQSTRQQQYQSTRQQQYQDSRQQYQDIRQQYQEPATRRPTQSSRQRVTQSQRTRATPRPRTRIPLPTRPPTTQPPRPPPTPAPRPQAQYDEALYGPEDYYYDYYDEILPTEEPVTPTAVAEHKDGKETKILTVSTFRPKGATDFYHEITTLKTMRHISLGRYTNSQWITQTQTRTVPIEPTVTPSPSKVATPTSTLTPSVLLVATTTTPKPQIDNLLGAASEAPVVMLPPVHLDPSSPSLPLHTMTETYSTTQLVLKSSVIPLVIADNTRSFTITQTYHVTRVVTALKTMPPVELFDERGLASSNAQLQGSHSRVDANGLPAPDNLADVGGKFDPDALEQSTHPEMMALHGSHEKPVTEESRPAATTAATAAAEATPVVSASPAGNPVIAPAPAATPALPSLNGNSLSPLNQLGQLSQLAQLSRLAQLSQTNQLGGLGQLTPQQLLYLQLLSPYLAPGEPSSGGGASERTSHCGLLVTSVRHHDGHQHQPAGGGGDVPRHAVHRLHHQHHGGAHGADLLRHQHHDHGTTPALALRLDVSIPPLPPHLKDA